MNIQTKEGRTVNSAREELELVVEEVKRAIENWRERLRDAPAKLPEVEREIHCEMGRLADLVLAGLLAEVGALAPTDEKIEAVREKAQDKRKAIRSKHPCAITRSKWRFSADSSSACALSIALPTNANAIS